MKEQSSQINYSIRKTPFLVVLLILTGLFFAASIFLYFFFNKDSTALDLVLFLFKQEYQSGSLTKSEFISFLFHLTLNWFTFSSAIYISLGCFFFDQIRNNRHIQFLGIIFIFWAYLSFIEFLVFKSPRENLNEFYWIVSRSSLAALYLLIFLIIAFFENFKITNKMFAISIICISTFSIAIYSTYFTVFNKNIPNLLFDGVLKHQLELIPAAIYFLLIICSYVFYKKSNSVFSLGLFIGFFPMTLGEVYIAFSPAWFINSYDLAQFLELFSLLFPLIGISIDNLSTFWVIESEKNKVFQANKTKDEFIGLLSNELNVPLNSSKEFIKSLKNESDGPLTEEQKLSLSKISANCTKVVKLINELADLTNIQSGKIILHKEYINLNKQVKNILEPLEIKAKEKNLIINIQIDPVVSAELDVLRLKQLFVNIFNYITQVSQEGEIKVENKPGILLEIYTKAKVVDENSLYLLEKGLDDIVFSMKKNIQTHLPLFISKIVLSKMGGALEFKVLNKEEFKFSITT